jgi:hypothetical protein
VVDTSNDYAADEVVTLKPHEGDWRAEIPDGLEQIFRDLIREVQALKS